jgi:hypothetical protein
MDLSQSLMTTGPEVVLSLSGLVLLGRIRWLGLANTALMHLHLSASC